MTASPVRPTPGTRSPCLLALLALASGCAAPASVDRLALGEVCPPRVELTAGMAAPARPPALMINSAPGPVEVTHRGTTLVGIYPPGNTLTVGTRAWTLDAIHFHVPSAHHVETHGFPLELHSVYSPITEAGPRIVLVTLFEEGDAHPYLSSCVPFLPAAAGARTTLRTPTHFDLRLLIDGKGYAFDYSTKAPLAPARWVVLRGVRSASAAQLSWFRDALDE